MNLKPIVVVFFISSLFLTFYNNNFAQEKVVIKQGMRVRLTAPDITSKYTFMRDRIAGNVIKVKNDTLVVDYRGKDYHGKNMVDTLDKLE